MRDLDHLHERSESTDRPPSPARPRASFDSDGSTQGRKLGLFALAGTLSIAAIISLGVVSGSSGSALDGDQTAPGELDTLSQLALTGADPKAPPPAPKAAVQLERLSFPATLVGDESTIEATVRAAVAEHAAETGHAQPRVRARAADVPVSTLATEQNERLSRSAKHDPLIAQAMPERGGVVAQAGSEGAFTLQVASYETRAVAERFADALRARGHRAFVAAAEVPGRARLFRVRVGPFAIRREALQYQANFERSERMHSILVTSSPK